jgi:phospholipase/carboxylesterase
VNFIKKYLKACKMNLHYLIKEPKTILDKNPLLLLLHGYGSNEEDLFSFASELPDDSFVVSVRAPYDLQPYGHAWYAIHFDADENKFSDNKQAKESVLLIAEFIDQIAQKHPIDVQNINLIGFSQGAILSYATALTYPEKIAKVVALSGYFNQDIVPEVIDASAISHLNFFISHGTVDQVIPVDWARKAKPALENLGLNVVYHEYPVGHGVAPQNFFDFKNWLIQNNNK